MYITKGDFRKTFREIKRTSLSHSTCKLVIFVSALDIDALCGAKMLTELLRKELIQYQVTPIVGYSDLISHYAQVSDEISNIILLGCCSMIPIEDVLNIEAQKFIVSEDSTNTVIKTTRKIYVIDGHKPWHLDNLFGSHIVVCFDDGYVNENLKEVLKSYNFMDEYIRDKKLKRIAKGLDPDEESDSDESDSDEDDEEMPTDRDDDEDSDEEQQIFKRRKIVDEKRERMRERVEHYQRLEDYYKKGTKISYSVSLQVYALLSEIGETNLKNLWIAITGTISLDTQNPDIYKHSLKALSAEVQRLSSNPKDIKRTADSFTITKEADYNLFLLRQYNLFDSLIYSSYVNSKLNCWTEKGKKQIYELLARATVPLIVAKEKWSLMDPAKRGKLVKEFNNGEVLNKFHLNGVKRQGFVRNFGFYQSISASEYVVALYGLLQFDDDTSDESLSRKKKKAESNGNEGIDNDEEDEEDEDLDQLKKSVIARKEKIWVNNFWRCWDALDTTEKGQQLLKKGIICAKESQKVVFESGKMILERVSLKRHKNFRYIIIEDLPELNRFRNPLLLKRLGDWLLDWYAGRENSTKPLLIASLDTRTDSYLVIGLGTRFNPELPITDELRDISSDAMNKFNLAFGRISEEINKRNAKPDSYDDDEDEDDEDADENKFTIRVDSFDAAIVEIEKKDLSQFLVGINRIFKQLRKEEEEESY